MDISAIGEVVLAFICFCFGLLLIMFFIGLILSIIIPLIFKVISKADDELKEKSNIELMWSGLFFYRKIFIPASVSFYYDKGKNLLKQIKG